MKPTLIEREIIEMRQRGVPYRVIEQRTGVKRGSVYGIAMRAGLVGKYVKPLKPRCTSCNKRRGDSSPLCDRCKKDRAPRVENGEMPMTEEQATLMLAKMGHRR